MLDLNYVRANLDKVRAALQTRGVAPSALDDFVQADAERRRLIATRPGLIPQTVTIWENRI